jgi:pyruvate dehydrogenase E1 component alpha subunit
LAACVGSAPAAAAAPGTAIPATSSRRLIFGSPTPSSVTGTPLAVKRNLAVEPPKQDGHPRPIHWTAHMAEPAADSMSSTELPEADVAREWLATMMLIRRFEERAGEMYAKAKVGGFLHLAIGEEATIVGSTRALRDQDYLISTYRSHGHTLARGSDPNRVMAELFGRVDGLCKGRGGSMHMFDLERRFMGGYGIVGGNLPIAAGFALASDYNGLDEATLCQFGDGASNQGTFGETMNLAALWKLPVVFMITNNRFGMGTALERHSAMTDLLRKGEGFGVPGMRCDGMDVQDTYNVTTEALRVAREERRPVLVEALTYRFRGHSMADPEEYRTKAQVDEWRKRDPVAVFGERLVEARILSAAERERLDQDTIRRIDDAVAFADASPHPGPNALYDDIYVLGDQVRGWYSVDERTPTPHRGEAERGMDSADLPHSAEHGGPTAPKPTDDAQREHD